MVATRSFQVAAKDQNRYNEQLQADLAPVLGGALASAQLVSVSKKQPGTPFLQRLAPATKGDSTVEIPLIAGQNLIPHSLGRRVVVYIVNGYSLATLCRYPTSVAPDKPSESKYLLLYSSAACVLSALVVA